MNIHLGLTSSSLWWQVDERTPRIWSITLNTVSPTLSLHESRRWPGIYNLLSLLLAVQHQHYNNWYYNKLNSSPLTTTKPLLNDRKRRWNAGSTFVLHLPIPVSPRKTNDWRELWLFSAPLVVRSSLVQVRWQFMEWMPLSGTLNAEDELYSRSNVRRRVRRRKLRENELWISSSDDDDSSDDDRDQVDEDRQTDKQWWRNLYGDEGQGRVLNE